MVGADAEVLVDVILKDVVVVDLVVVGIVVMVVGDENVILSVEEVVSSTVVLIVVEAAVDAVFGLFGSFEKTPPATKVESKNVLDKFYPMYLQVLPL